MDVFSGQNLPKVVRWSLVALLMLVSLIALRFSASADQTSTEPAGRFVLESEEPEDVAEYLDLSPPRERPWYLRPDQPDRAVEVVLLVDSDGAEGELSITMESSDFVVEGLMNREIDIQTLSRAVACLPTDFVVSNYRLHYKSGEPQAIVRIHVRMNMSAYSPAGRRQFDLIWRSCDAIPSRSKAPRFTVNVTYQFSIVSVTGGSVERQEDREVVFSARSPGPTTLTLDHGEFRQRTISATESDVEPDSQAVTLEIAGMPIFLGFKNTGALSWLGPALAPWLLLWWAIRRRVDPGLRIVSRLILAGVSITTFSILMLPGYMNDVTMFVIIVLIVVGARANWPHLVSSPEWGDFANALAVLVCAIVAQVAIFNLNYDWPTLLVSVVITAGSCGIASVLFFSSPVHRLEGCLVGAALACVAALDAGSSANAVQPIALGCSLIIIGSAAILMVFQRDSPRMRIVLAAAGCTIFIPVAGILVAPQDHHFVDVEAQLGRLLILLGLVICVCALFNAYRVGSTAAGMRDELLWASSLAALSMLTFNLDGWVDVAVVIVGICLWSIVIPLSRAQLAASLAAVAQRDHVKLVRAETRRRVFALSAHDLYRRSRANLGDMSASPQDYERRQTQLDSVASPLNRRVAGVDVQFSLSTGGGYTPRQNALAALVYATPVIVPFLVYESWGRWTEWNDWWSYYPTAMIFWVLFRSLRWAGYALIYGYFYSMLRGRTPAQKAVLFGVLVAGIELLSVVSSIVSGDISGATSEEVLLAFAIRLGQVVVLSSVLCFAWEYRLAVSAGLGWDRIRNVRSIRAVAAPVSTVLIAVATAVGTAVAGVAVAGLLGGTPSDSPAGTQPTDTTSSQPAAGR